MAKKTYNDFVGQSAVSLKLKMLFNKFDLKIWAQFESQFSVIIIKVSFQDYMIRITLHVRPQNIYILTPTRDRFCVRPDLTENILNFF